MKYLKYFEGVYYDDINVGDYVVVTCVDNDLIEEIVIVDSKERNYSFNKSEYTIDAHLIGQKIKNGYTFYGSEIVRKIKPNEVELFLNTKKYNL